MMQSLKLLGYLQVITVEFRYSAVHMMWINSQDYGAWTMGEKASEDTTYSYLPNTSLNRCAVSDAATRCKAKWVPPPPATALLFYGHSLDAIQMQLTACSLHMQPKVVLVCCSRLPNLTGMVPEACAAW
jgi:hypothetical protein